MRQIEVNINVDKTSKWGTFFTSIGGITIDGYFDMRDEDLDLSQITIGEQSLPTYLVPTKIYNYLHDLVLEEL